MGDTGLADFETWYRALHPRVLTTLAAPTGDADLARDATDEALARAYERWGRVSAMDSPGAWTYRVACNVAHRRMRRRALEHRLLRKHAPTASVAGPAGELWLLVAELPPRQATAVVLRHVGQLTEIEIGAVMGIKRGTVSATLRTAYERLRTSIATEDPSEVRHA